MGEAAPRRREPPARVGVLRAAWAARLVEALPPPSVRSRAEKRLALRPEGVFDHLARIDRSLRKVHLQRLCQWFVAGAFRVEDARPVRDLLLRFEAARRRLPVEGRDLNRFPGPGDLEEALDRADGVVAADPLGSEALPPEVLAECAVVASAPTWHVIRLDGPRAATHFADGTRWCTRHPGTFEGYRSRGPVYLLRHHRRRVQMHAASGQLMDERDRSLDSKGLAAFPAAARHALVRAVIEEHGEGAPLADDWSGRNFGALGIVCRLLGMDPRGASGGSGGLVLDAPRRGVVVWSSDESRGATAYAFAAEDGEVTPQGWRPDAAFLAAAFADRAVPPELLLDLGPAVPTWSRDLDDARTAHAVAYLCGHPRMPRRYEAQAMAAMAATGALGRAILVDPAWAFSRFVDKPGSWDPGYIETLAAALPDGSDPAWGTVREEDAAAWSMTSVGKLVMLPMPGERVGRAFSAYATLPWVAASVAKRFLPGMREAHLDAIDYVTRIRSAGYPGHGAVVLALLEQLPFAQAMFDDVMDKAESMAAGFGAMCGDRGPEVLALREVLARVVPCLPPDAGRLPGEGPEAAVARACLSGSGAFLRDSFLRDELARLCHPDFRDAYLALSADAEGRLYRRRPDASVDAAAILRLLELPGTGHLVAALPPAERLGPARRALELGRAGIVACLPARLATPDTYRSLLASPECTDLLDLASVTPRHVAALEEAGTSGLRLNRMRGAAYATHEGIAWLRDAALEREASVSPPGGHMDPERAGAYVQAGAGVRSGIGRLVAAGSLPAPMAREAIRHALAASPWLVSEVPECADLMPRVRPDQALDHPHLLAYVAAADLDAGSAVRLAWHLPTSALATLGRAIPEPAHASGPWPRAFGWIRVREPDGAIGRREARILLGAVPLDPGSPLESSEAAWLLAKAGPMRPRRPDGRPWPWLATLRCFLRKDVRAGFRALHRGGLPAEALS